MVIEGDRWVLQLACDWPQLLRIRSLLTFRLLELTPEWDRALGSVKLDIALAGFRLHVGFTYADTPLREAMADLTFGASVVVRADELAALRADAAKWRARGRAA